MEMMRIFYENARLLMVAVVAVGWNFSSEAVSNSIQGFWFLI
jgi:hypothetical protein